MFSKVVSNLYSHQQWRGVYCSTALPILTLPNFSIFASLVFLKTLICLIVILMRMNIFSHVYGPWVCSLWWSFHTIALPIFLWIFVFSYWFIGVLYVFWVLNVLQISSFSLWFIFLFSLWYLLMNKVLSFNS